MDATDDVRSLVTLFDEHETVLVGHRSRVTDIVTRGDLARYLYSIAEPFMLLEEIERTTRSLMKRAVPEPEIAELIRLSLEPDYANRPTTPIPSTLEKLTLSELVAVLLDKRHWPRFEVMFKTTLVSARGKYQSVPTIRNDVLHFRADWSPERRNVLLTCRSWLVRRVQMVEHTEGGTRG